MPSEVSSNPPHSKIILISGCSSGFGLMTAARLASKGHAVIATMRDLSKRNVLLSEINRRGGQADQDMRPVDVLRLDVTDQGSIREAIAHIAAEYGYVDVLVNNAGYGIGGFFEDLTQEEIRQQMETNFFGVQNLTRAVIPLMRPRKMGRIINISSVAGFSTSPAFGAYNASKWALEAFSESLHYELRLFGIDVLLVEPGTYRTKIFFENARYAKNFDDPQSPYYAVSQHLRKKVMAYVEDCHKDIEEVPALIERLMTASNPPFRSIPDIESKILYLLRKFLPFRVYRGMLRAMLFQGSPKR